MTCNDEMVEVKIKMPRKVFDALSWYVEFTNYWKCSSQAEESISNWISDAVLISLKFERDSGVPDACKFITSELRALLEPTF